MKEVSDWEGYFVTKDGEVIGKRGRPLKGKITWDGYSEVVLSEGKKRRNVRVHILIVENFIGAIPSKMCVNHIDGNKLNNNLSNLEIVSIGENVRHAFINNLFKNKDFKGKRIPCSLTKDEILDMKQMRDNGSLYRQISEKYNLSTRADYVGEILSGRKLSEISGFVFRPETNCRGQVTSKHSDPHVVCVE